MRNDNEADVKDKIDKKEELSELLRILSMPSTIKSEGEYGRLLTKAKNLIAEGYLSDNGLEEFINKVK